MTKPILMALFCASVLGCSSQPKNSREPAAVLKTSFLEEVRSVDTFKTMGTKPGGLVTTGEVLKFIIDNRAYPKPASIYYINSNYCDKTGCPVDWIKLHRTWAEHNLKNFNYDSESFSTVTYRTNDLAKKKFVEGRIQTFEWQGKVFYGVWFVEMDQIAEESIRFALEYVQKTFSLPGENIHLVTYSTQQTTTRIAAWLAANHIEEHHIGDLIADVKVQSLNPGDAYGFLRLFPKDPDDLEATDIAVFNILPLDLAVVAGTITTGFQDVGSHINLKSKERGTPNVMVRDPALIEKLKALDGQPVHLKVTGDGYTVEPSTARMVQDELDKKLNRQWVVSNNDMADTIFHFDEMCNQDPKICLSYARRFGGKGSRLGFMAHKKVIGEGSDIRKKFGYRLSPVGFAVPIKMYKDFMDYNIKINPDLKALQELIDSETGKSAALNSTEKKAKIAIIQHAILNGKFPPGMYARFDKEVAKLKATVAATYPGEDLNKLKFRSSANVEDVEGFNGAGLHDSFSAKIAKSKPEEADGACQTVAGSEEDVESKLEVEPESVACAIKGTYSSLWNLRAVRERTYRRFDHNSALMGLAVMPSHKFRSVPKKLEIIANSVLVTRVLNTTTTYGYQISTQKDDNLVTNPIPETLAELASMTFQLHANVAMTILRFALPDKDKPALTASVLPLEKMQQMVEIGRAIEEAYCNYKPDYAPGIKCAAVSNSQRKPKALDMEVKIYDNGEISFKQMREFSGH